MGSTVSSFAAESEEKPGPALIAEGAGVVPGSVTDTPVAESGAEAGDESTDPLEEDLPVPGETDGPELSPAPKVPLSNYCGPGHSFVHITQNKKNTMSVKYETFVENHKSYPIDFKFTTKKSGTTTVGGSVTISSEFKVMWLGKIKADINVNASKSWTSDLGVETGGEVRAHDKVYGKYGIMKEKVYGYTGYMYSNCDVGQKNYMTVWAPYREGWVID
ncbi:hypothetical protein [Streptomyces sp. NPDC002952]|uniref:hypothetical protein n=1 Tax=Streptomyces sp. NPDC002952 TaxID=3364673 RepID=UPI00368466EA